MATIRYIKDENENVVLPVTHERGVIDSQGTNLETKLSGKQDTLVSGTNIKTINNASLLGPGNIEVQTEITMDEVPTSGSENPVKSGGLFNTLSGKQATLVSGTNIKTINNTSLLGSGNINVTAEIPLDNVPASGSNNAVKSGGVYTSLQDKQDALVSGTNIKTINDTSLLGSGNITIEGGVGFDDITTPSTPDGSMEIGLTNGDTITIDLNHNHPQYLKYEYLTSESQMPATPDPTTLYLILDSNA